MRKRRTTYILGLFILFLGGGLYSLNADQSAYTASLPELELIEEAQVPDTTLLFPVAKTSPEEYNDIVEQSQSSMDLHNPENLKTTIDYDLRTGMYIIRTKIGDMEINTPISLTPKEYQDYSLQQSLRAYFKKKNADEFEKEAKKQFNIGDIQLGLGAAERIFGPGGIRIKTQGSAEVILGMKSNKTDNPSLPERSRGRTFFNFDENVQLNVQASVGSKVNFDMNYNTETSFDFDSKKLKLAYTGEEDEIIKSLEAGNVTMNTNNSLINGGAALFGMKADLQFGKLRINALFAQQESESKTVNSKGGAQTKPFELRIDQYDERRHFFLGHYFWDEYDAAMATLPLVSSPVNINKLEVWVTNKRGNYDQARNIVAFSDLAENKHISNPKFIASGTGENPSNGANTLYNTVLNQYPDSREISKVTQSFDGFMEGGSDYEKVESARRLDPSEYTFNKQLGYISLKTQLQQDEVLAVAYEYTMGGTVYQVGEFSTDNAHQPTTGGTNTTNQCLYVKLLKGTTLSPNMPYWKLMMKNIYSLNGYSVQKDKFRLDILYQSDTTGTYVNYIPEGAIANQILLKVMNLDRLDSKNERFPDGFFDFIDGLTIQAEEGKVIFPVVEPFGSHLYKQINNESIASKYVYQELYDSTLTVAQQIAEKNKFLLRGEYKASSGSEIQLGASNVARGSVRVTANGATLVENVDYTVDYNSGFVTILNESIIASGVPVSVSLENRSVFNMQRKTMMGLDLNYAFSKAFTLGGTIMHMSEMPVTTKTVMGDESIRNTLWGLNTSYKAENQWLTNVFDKLPLLNLTKPSQVSFNAEFAHLIAGHYESGNTGGYSYIDDFESTQSGFDLSDPYPWNLSSVPFDDNANARFPEAKLVNDISYGKNRALIAWYNIDAIFTRKNSSGMPNHIKNDPDQRSNHFVREVLSSELFPNKQMGYNENNTLRVLNLAYYPKERGPYNLDAEGTNSDGTLSNPEKRFGGITRKIEQSDFEASNIEYIEFWVMDPFVYNPNVDGGDLYFNLGDVSEDVLKDEKKFFENGLPIDGNMSLVDTTVWGKVPRQQSTVYAFDNTAGARAKQDVGLNGLSTEEEFVFPTYVDYLNKLKSILSADALAKMETDPFSPLHDPAGDKYHFYRGSDFDATGVDILTRYKHYNGTEGNSTSSEDSPERYDISAKTIPDVEDINQDNTLSENEKYYEYRVSIRPKDTVVGTNNIVDKRIARVTLANGDTSRVTWYQFKVPIKNYDRRVGSIRDFKSIRFMRMYMTDFKENTVLRFGSFKLVRGDWRRYTQSLSSTGSLPSINGSIDVSTVNIEENGDKSPVNYILPPGITRAIDPGQPQLVQQNEQALSLKITNLAPQDARAIYKSTSYDFRQYKRIQLFTHAEAFEDNLTNLVDGDLYVFIRLGSDYKNNYYEYAVPLKLTPQKHYSSNSGDDRLAVWPKENLLDFKFEVLTDAKLHRNKAKREGTNISYQTLYSENDKEKPLNMISVMGNPSLSEVKTIMIGVRNNSKDMKSAEVWVNELRLTDFNEEGGWAANANLNIALSDLGTINVGGRIETSGFGALDQSVSERRMDDYTQLNLATTVELGKLFPEKAKVSIPLYYAYSEETTSPKYNPLDQDIKLADVLSSVNTQAERDSIKNFSQDHSTIKSLSLSNVRVDIKSKTPMPYDPANFSLGYSYSENNRRNPETEYETTKDYRANFSYNYIPYAKPFRPFSRIKADNGYTKFVKQISINYLPSSVSFQTAMMRNYYELQLRDLNNMTTGTKNNIPVSFSQNFYWDRAFSLNWSFTNNLTVSFKSGTNARIIEPHVQVNKKLNPDQYQVWKDSVMQSIADLGRPMKYDQLFTATWNLPMQYIPVLDWVNGSVTYNASYNWDRGAELEGNIELGNILKNQRQIDGQGSLNLVALYNKNPFLKKVNARFNQSTRTNKAPVKKKEVKLEKEIQLNLDSGTVVEHGMFTKKVHITARGADGRLYAIKFKPINFAQVMITNRDTAHLRLTIKPGPSPKEDILVKTAQYTTRFLMMLRRLNIQYSATDGMMLPGYRPEVGDIFGQGRSSYGLNPGLGFAFGAVNRSFITDAANKGYLVMDDNVIDPAIINRAKTLNINATLEPITGLKITLNADRVDTRTTDIQYMYKGMPEIRGGSFTMTTIAIGSAFEGMGSSSNGYSSKAFDQFLRNRYTIAERLERKYAGTRYPSGNFMEGNPLAGHPYDPRTGAVNRNSADVLIPAFLAAYTGGNAKSISLTAFPSISRLLPNWRVTYDGLNKLPIVKKYMKNLLLSHQYRCSYSVGAFSSFLNWADAGQDGLGYVRDVLTGNPTPSSPYDISSVSITEGFSPLFGVDATLLNNITGKLEYRTTRNLSLNVTSYQLIESNSNEVIVGMGYKLTEFNKVLKMKKTKNFSNDLTVSLDFSYRKMQSLIRKIEDGFTQATSGNIAKTIQFSADYGLSRALSVRAFYDLQINKPLVSSASYPTSNSNYGISFRFSLAQ